MKRKRKGDGEPAPPMFGPGLKLECLLLIRTN